MIEITQFMIPLDRDELFSIIFINFEIHNMIDLIDSKRAVAWISTKLHREFRHW